MHSAREYLVAISERYKNMHNSIIRVNMQNALANTAVKAVLIGGAALIEGMNVFLIMAVAIEIILIHGFKYNSLHRLCSYFGYITLLGLAALYSNGAQPVILSASAALMNVMILAYFLMPRAQGEKESCSALTRKQPLFSLQFDPNGHVLSRFGSDKDHGQYPVLNAVNTMPEFMACFNNESVNMLRLAMHSMKLDATPISVICVFHGSSYMPVMVKFLNLNAVEIHEIVPSSALSKSVQNSRNLHEFQAIAPINIIHENMNGELMGRSVLSHTTIENTAVSRNAKRCSIAM